MPERVTDPRAAARAILVVLLGFACSILVGACATAPARETGVKPDEDVVLFPTAARLDAATSQWVVPIHGWVHRRPDDSLWTSAPARALMRALDLDEDALAQAVFRARVRWFLTGTTEDRHLVVRVAAREVTTDPSGENGLFRATATLSQDEIAKHRRNGVLPIAVPGPAGTDRPFEGAVRLVGPHGVSVISDIDDTVKESNVLSKRALMANTFLKPFEAAPGMAEAYAAWADRGAAFHFVSSSPWQLYPPLAEFLAEAGFPPATFHLREIGLRDRSVLDIFDAPEDTKLPTISGIMQRWPQRRFILVGDSGERDPEIYARILAAFPDRVLHIFIRNVTGEGEDAPRYRRAFADVPRDRWTVFIDPADLTRRVTLPAP